MEALGYIAVGGLASCGIVIALAFATIIVIGTYKFIKG